MTVFRALAINYGHILRSQTKEMTKTRHVAAPVIMRSHTSDERSLYLAEEAGSAVHREHCPTSSLFSAFPNSGKLIAWPLNRPMKCPFYVLLIQSCQSFKGQITHCCILKEIAKEAPADLLRATVWCYLHHLKRIQSPHSLCRTVVWVINVSLSFYLWKPKQETAVHNLPGRICLFSEDNRGRRTCHRIFSWLMERPVKLLVARATGR